MGKPICQAWDDGGHVSLRDSVRRIPYACMCPAVGFMVGVRVMFGIVVGPVFRAGIPIVSKLVLRCTAAEPPKSHVHHFAPSRNNGVVSNPCSSRVVSLDRRFGLGPAHVDEGLAMWDHFTSCDEQSGKFGFGR